MKKFKALLTILIIGIIVAFPFYLFPPLIYMVLTIVAVGTAVILVLGFSAGMVLIGIKICSILKESFKTLFC